MAARSTFPAGLALDAHKQQACGTPIVELPLPAHVVLALDQGTGYSAEPVVAVGEAVAAGTLVARADHPFASAVHAPLAGIVVAIETREAAVEGGRGVCIVIEGDGSDRIDDSVRPVADPASLSPEELVQRMRDAGIAGLGGAGFPTPTKLASARDLGAHTLVLNGAECEPWICCDDALMRSAADDVVLGALILRRAAGAVRCVIAIEDDKPAAIAAVTGAIERLRDDALTLAVVPAVYPQGAERQLHHRGRRCRSAFGRPAGGRGRGLPERGDRGGRRTLGHAWRAHALSRRDRHWQRRRAPRQRPRADRHSARGTHRSVPAAIAARRCA